MAEPVLRADVTASEVDAWCAARISECREILRGILADTAPRAARNTIEPLNRLQGILGDTWNAVAALRCVHPVESVRTAAESSEQAVARFSSDLGLDRGLYDCIRACDPAGLDPAARRMLERTLRDFHRAGVDRDEAVRDEVRALREELVSVGQEFLRNIVQDVRAILLEGPGDLQGLPADYVERHPPDPDGRIRICTDHPDYTPFMTYAHSREHRRRLYTEFRSRAHPENLGVLRKILEKRHRLASLLGYPSWAAYATEEQMSRSPNTVAEFLDRVHRVARPRARREYEVLLEAKREGEPTAAAVHDWEKAYWEEIVRLRRFRVDSKEVRTYFEFTRVLEGLLSLVERLFGISFRRAAESPRWHPAVEVLDVFEGSTRVGRVYLDMHPREGKFKHAAMFPLVRGIRGGPLPEAALVCNFPDPREVQGPALLEHEDVVTLFHEFGHLLHHLLASDGKWVRFAGTGTEWDFVEVPSQLFEEWAWEYEVLREFAVHHSSGARIPEALVAELRRSREFGTGLWVCHQLFYAAFSLRCHDQDPSAIDTDGLARELQDRYSLFGFVDGTHFEASFGHLDDYSALYYTYVWSLAIEKDLFGAFRSDGIFGREVARRYRREVLAPGGTRDASELVRSFLGREYTVQAFERWLSGGYPASP